MLNFCEFQAVQKSGTLYESGQLHNYKNGSGFPENTLGGYIHVLVHVSSNLREGRGAAVRKANELNTYTADRFQLCSAAITRPASSRRPQPHALFPGIGLTTRPILVSLPISSEKLKSLTARVAGCRAGIFAGASSRIAFVKSYPAVRVMKGTAFTTKINVFTTC